MCGLLGSSKRLPTAVEPALRPMGAVPRGAEDTCLPPELFVAHHAAPGPAAGLAACSLRRPLPRAALPRGRGGDSVPRGSSAASPRPAARPPTRLDVPRSLLRAYLSSKKKKKRKGKNSCCGRLPALSPAARPSCSPACWGSAQQSPERCWQPGGFSLGRKPAFCSKEGVFMGCVCMLNRSQSERCRMQNTLENLLAFGT